MTKTDIVNTLSETTRLTRQQVAGVFDELGSLIKKNLDEQGPGVFTIPGLLRIKVGHKPATEARQGVNPFTKQQTVFKAKPARNVVKVVPLKRLRQMVGNVPT
jgi:nucleoid DNA-binding protein